MSTATLCTTGIVNQSHTIEEGFKFDDKVYTSEDAVAIEREGFARTQIFSSSALAGSYDLGGEGNATRPFITIHMGLKPGMQKTLQSEHYEASWIGELDGFTANSCRYMPKTLKRVVEVDRTICVKKVATHSDLCLSEVIGTVKQNQLLSGALNEVDSTFLNQVVLDAMIETNHINVDRHAWQGDYGSPDPRVKHVDGFFKIAKNAADTSQGQAITYVFTGDLTGESIMGLAGGKKFAIDFDTDTDTTVVALIAFLAGLYEPMSGRKLFKSVTKTATNTMKIIAHDGLVIDLNMVLGASAKGFELCPSDGTLKAHDPAGTGITFTATENQEAITCLTPISLDIVPVTSANVLSVLDEWYQTVNSLKPETLETEFGGNLMVARNIYNAYRFAVKQHTRTLTGDFGSGLTELDYMGIRMVPMNYMAKDTFMFAGAQDLHIGVDLVGDATTFRQWRSEGTDVANFKGAMSLGFQISRADRVSGTFCDPTANRLHFESALMPCSPRRDNKFLPVAEA